MISRPQTSTSERQLIFGLAASGRKVSLEELALWRKNGLLPPLASYGPKTPIRSYYWYEPDILARAELVFDALKDEVEVLKPLILENMKSAMLLPNDVPVEAEVGVGFNWLEAH